ncbi:MAG: hypothetical protein NTY20_01700 [Candidatus Aenigmarchaeota archaeon]|nr:hypothetical protein [Candidatus Aenigmarchaeota archaeon]
MKEIDELSTGIEKLKKNSDSQKRLIEQLQKDRAFLIERTRFLGQKLGEAYVIYEEAGKRILDFVDKETAPIKNQIAELKAETRKISAIEQELKIHTSYLSKIRSGDESLKNRLLEAEKVIKKLSELTSLSKSHIERLREKEAKEDEALESRLTETKGHFETQLKTAQDRLSLKISEASEEVLQDATDSVNVLAASHEELKRNLSRTSLFVRQLKVNTVSLKKQLENAGFSRAEIEKRVSGHQASIKELDSAVSKIAKRLDSINLEDEKLEKRLAELRKSADESISSKTGQLKAHFDLNQKRQAELFETRMKAVYEDFAARVAKINERLASERKEMGSIESLISRKIAESQKTVSLRESRLEKEIAGVRKHAAEAIDYKVGQLKSHIEISDQKQVELIERRLKAIAEFDRKISEIRKSAEESISSKAGQLKAHADLNQKRHAELLEARLKAVYEEFAGRIAKINESLAGERRDIADVESLINERIKESQENFDSKLSESYDHIENRISHVSSHVASEKKAVAEMKIVLERGIREEQKALSSKITGLSEKSWQRISGLSGDVSAEKKNLAEQRAKFSENIRNTVQAIARLNEFTKSLDSRIKKHEYSASEKIEKNEEEVSDALKRIDSLATGLEKSGSFSKDLNVKLGRMESQIYSERKALLEKVKSMESSLRTSSLVTSALNKQLNALSSSKVSADKRISGAETRMKQLQAIDSAIGSKVEKHHIDFQNLIKEQAKNAEFRTEIEKRVSSQQEYVKGMESALTRVVKMIENVNVEDKRLEKRLSEDKEEMMRKLLEEQQSDKAEISKLREEIADLKKDIKEWQEEQIKLYELLKEED